MKRLYNRKNLTKSSDPLNFVPVPPSFIGVAIFDFVSCCKGEMDFPPTEPGRYKPLLTGSYDQTCRNMFGRTTD